jgi:hypothetical protein
VNKEFEFLKNGYLLKLAVTKCGKKFKPRDEDIKQRLFYAVQ